MLQQAIQPTTIDRAPGAVQIFAGLRLLARVVVIYELVKYSLFLSVVVIPNSFFSGRAYVVCGRYVLTGQRFTKRKWRRAPWRPRQWSTRPRQFKLKSGAVSKYLERTHLWKKKKKNLVWNASLDGERNESSWMFAFCYSRVMSWSNFEFGSFISAFVLIFSLQIKI